MRLPSCAWPRRSALDLLFLSSLCLLPEIRAITFQPAPSPNLDLSGLGRVLLGGNFDSASLYDFTSQNEDGLSQNGTQSLYGRYPSGAFAELQSSDAYIQAMCVFQGGVVLAGNFTSIGSTQADAAALWVVSTGEVTPLPGLNGYLNAVFCDTGANTVYVGGDFTGGNSTNAIAWINGWTNMPFAGFNGPVSAITQMPNGNIVFGGSFSVIGNLTAIESETGNMTAPQVVNVGSANITASGASLTPQYSNPSDIICTTPGQSSPSSTFLLQADAPGSITADFGFGFEPSVLRLLNTQVPGWGTKTWRFTSFPINGIMNFTYVENGVLQSCTSQCPMAQNSSYQEFYFVNTVGMNSFRIDMSDWYGEGAGLGGIELLQPSIWSYAVDNFNSPNCDGVSNTNASSTNTGDWTVAPAGDSYSQYLTTYLPQGTVDSTTSQVIFMPNIEVSGKYSINMWTPGCLADNTCSTRGEVNITANFGTPTGTSSAPYTTTLYQTNNYIKFDQIYDGYIEAAGDGFRPSITLTPSLNQNRPLTVVAQSLGLNLTSAEDTTNSNSKSSDSSSSDSSTGGLNGLYEYNPNLAIISPNFSTSAIDMAGMSLNENANILSLQVINGDIYAAGSFTSASGSFKNIMAVLNGNATDLGNGGLNDVVQSIYYDNGMIYTVGNFSASMDGSVTGLDNVASYSVADKTWHALGAGVNGIVNTAIPISVNVSGTLTQGIAFSGFFDQLNAFGSHPAVSVSDTAIWVPSSNEWLSNLDAQSISLDGRLNAYTTVPGQGPIYAGSIESQEVDANDIVGLSSSNGLKIEQYPFNIQPTTGSNSEMVSKRAVSQGLSSGVFTAVFYNDNGLNLTIAGGSFTAIASTGSKISNLAIVNGTDNVKVTGLAYNTNTKASVRALDYSGTTLYIGGSIEDGILFYDLVQAQRSSSQPAPISGGDATVNAIALQPKSSNLYVGGGFENAGTLGCPGLCVFDTQLNQWNPPPATLSGKNTINILQWASDERLLLAGLMTIDGSVTTMAEYNAKTSKFTAIANAGTLPGPITAYSAMDSAYSTAFAAGASASNSSAYLSYFDGQSTWTTISGLGAQTKIEGLQTLSLSNGHGNSGTLPSNVALLVMGLIELPSFGNVSAALFNGTDFIPFVLSTMGDGSPGILYGAFVQNPANLLNKHNNFLALGLIVLVGLACALGVVFALVVLGILVERIRRRREGYVPAPTGPMYEKGGNVGGISPERLFGGVGGGGGGGSGGGPPRI